MTTRQVRHQKKAFIETFRRHGNVSWACREIGVNRADVYRWKEHDEEFMLLWNQAEIEATETMEQEAYRRAVQGTAEPVFHQGAEVGTVQKYSDTLLIFMLKARAPEKYRERLDITSTSTVQAEAERIAAKFGKTPEEVLRDAGVGVKGGSDAR